MLAGRRIVLGVSGGVAAYKAAYLARRLVEAGAEVRCIMTSSAQQFLGPQTLAAITGNEPVSDLFGAGEVSPHTTLAQWADVIVVAPATAATMGRIATGISDDALSATVLASRVPVVVAPAMHTEMWEHPATVRNVATLRGFGYTIVEPDRGALAGGDEGIGRLADPDAILAIVVTVAGAGTMVGQKVIITAGGTREPIDAVRFIGNRSSGKMGNALATSAANHGAEVVIVTAADPPGHPGVSVVAVETAEEMAHEVWSRLDEVDVAVMAAAVADFRSRNPGDDKLRRAEGPPALDLEPTPDILAGIASRADRPYLVGFAAEAGSLDEVVAKADRKGVDLLVANDVNRPGSGFGSETNEVTLVFPDGSTEPWEQMPKSDVADRLWERIADLRSKAGT